MSNHNPQVQTRLREKKIAHEAKTNPKKIFTYIRTKKTIESYIGLIANESGVLTQDRGQMAEILNTNFVSVFTIENLETVPESPALRCRSQALVNGEGCLRQGVKQPQRRSRRRATRRPCQVPERGHRSCALQRDPGGHQRTLDRGGPTHSPRGYKAPKISSSSPAPAIEITPLETDNITKQEVQKYLHKLQVNRAR